MRSVHWEVAEADRCPSMSFLRRRYRFFGIKCSIYRATGASIQRLSYSDETDFGSLGSAEAHIRMASSMH